MPGHLGLFLGLSGVRLSSAADLLFTGIATHYIPEDQLQVGCGDWSQEACLQDSALAGNSLAGKATCDHAVCKWPVGKKLALPPLSSVM